MSIRNEKEKLKPGERSQIMNALSLFTHIGLTMAICIGGCIWFGRFLDNTFDTGPIFILVFALVGIVSAFWTVYKIVIKTIK
ncbi:MAG: AtpZ/AtpI family protein [Defluviitaleaceae bacterium]|nr:AtpZ/AtpI family protein [Defluviitaleaceae bacterium]